MTARPQLADALHAAWGYGRAGRAALRAAQDAALRRLVLHAYEQVRYYRRLFDRHRLHPRHLRGVVDVDLIPLTARGELLAQREADLLARDAQRAALLAVPALDEDEGRSTLCRTWLEDLVQLLHRVRCYSGLGMQAGDRIAIVGAGHAPDRERHGLALHLLGLHRRRVVDGTRDPRVVVADLGAFRPDVLAGTPAMLDRLIVGAVAGSGLRPRLVVVEGKPPMPRLRARLAAAFGAPVLATYGLGADTVLATECRVTGAYHVADGAALVEVLVDGRPAATGERGEVAVTLLHAYAMPVLRLGLGHRATRGGPCACGAPFSTIIAPDA